MIMKVISLLVFLIPMTTFALDLDTVSDQVSKDSIKQALSQMEASGQFSKEQIAAAKKQLEQMSDSEYKTLISNGIEQSQDPGFQKKVQEAMGN